MKREAWIREVGIREAGFVGLSLLKMAGPGRSISSTSSPDTCAVAVISLSVPGAKTAYCSVIGEGEGMRSGGEEAGSVRIDDVACVLWPRAEH